MTDVKTTGTSSLGTPLGGDLDDSVAGLFPEDCGVDGTTGLKLCGECGYETPQCVYNDSVDYVHSRGYVEGLEVCLEIVKAERDYTTLAAMSNFLINLLKEEISK